MVNNKVYHTWRIKMTNKTNTVKTVVPIVKPATKAAKGKPMSKNVTPKTKSKGVVGKKESAIDKVKSPKVTIRSVVDKLFDKNPAMTFDIMLPIIKKAFPETKFQKSHWSWYKHQIINLGRHGKRG